MSRPGVSDDTWQLLDPAAARLPGSTRLRLAAWLALAAGLLLAVLLATASGLLFPRISVGSVSTNGGQRSCVTIVELKNNGWFDEHVDGMSLRPRGTGARLVRGFSGVLPSGGSRTVRVDYPRSWCEPYFDTIHLHQPPMGADLALDLHAAGRHTSTTVSLTEPPAVDGFTLRW